MEVTVDMKISTRVELGIVALADIAVNDAAAFAQLVAVAKENL